jgi:hypothetical protein
MYRRAKHLAKSYLLVLTVAGILYGISCAPGAVWQDSGLIQYRVWHGDIEGRLGLALSHPLYYIVAIGAGRIPLGEFGHRVNCISALAGAIAVANLYLLMRLWLGRAFPAAIAAMTLALSHTFWWHASIAETYTLWAALFLGELVCLLQYTRTRRPAYLYLLGLLNGMAVAVHMLGTIPLACYAVFVAILLAKRAIRLKDAAVFAMLWIVGALPYEYLIVRNIVQSGDVLGTLASAAFGDRWRANVLNTSLSWKIAKENILFAVLNFPTPNVLLFFAGCYGLRRIGPAAFRYVVLALLVLFLLFASRYTVPDRYAFFIPFYCMVAVMIGVGTQEIAWRVRHRAVPVLIVIFALLLVGVYAGAPQLAGRANLRIGTRQDIPYRNDYEYFLRPWRTGYRGAERFATEALEGVESNAIVWADITTVAPLLYVQEVKGLRPDVHIVSGIASSKGAPPFNERAIGTLLDEHPVYVVSQTPGYCPAFILEKYRLVKAGILWRVVSFEQGNHGILE